MEKMEQSKLKEFTCLFSEKIENRLGLCCEQKKDGDRLESKRNCKDSECYLWSAHILVWEGATLSASKSRWLT